MATVSGIFVPRFANIDVFGQLTDTTKSEDLEKFLHDHGMQTDFLCVQTTSPAQSESKPAEGFAIVKLKDCDASILPFGMIVATAVGSTDYMIIHPQVFLTFFEKAAEASTVEEAKAE